ncbi:galactose-1-phosphate uridylyltransferase [Actinokineospora sp.]|uniref:galactose-1-phosphate uridylyltransferase n=1 Tax=Actinokineospora sp. TaxID=1872133 RepID=UPI00403829CA
MRRTVRTLADGREIIYFDSPAAPERTAVDPRDLPRDDTDIQLRRDPLTDEWVVQAAHRQSRTYKPPAGLCPLCPSAPARPTEIPESDYEVVVFENRFPSFTAPAGRCEVVCFTADHTTSFGALSPDRVRMIVDVWADRTAALGALPGVEQVFPFENRGDEIGVTLAHPHGQVYGYPFVTPRTERMLQVAARYLAEHGRPVMGDVLNDARARVLVESAHWTAFVPAAARWPVEVHVVPHRQVPDLPALTDAERADFARVYLRVLGRLDGLYDRELPYVAAWHQAPVRTGRDLAWLHLEVFSILRTADKLKYLAGSESGMAVWINDVLPADLAARLRAAPARYGH